MQEVVEARLVRYQDGRSDVQVRLKLDDTWTLLHRLLEQRLRIVQFIPFPDSFWGPGDDDIDVVAFQFPGCAIIEGTRTLA